MRKLLLPIILFGMLLSACVGGSNEGDGISLDAIYVLNEGSYANNNASISVIDPQTGVVTADLFSQVNGEKLGDVAQHILPYGEDLFVVVNLSQKLLRLDGATLEVEGAIEGLTSPRYVAIHSQTKGYISDIADSSLTIFNPTTMEVTGSVDLSSAGPVEQMVVVGDRLYAACWSFGHEILVISTSEDRIVDRIDVGVQPCSIVADAKGNIWCLTDGGYEGNVAGHEAPRLSKISTLTNKVVASYEFVLNDYFSARLVMNGTRDTLYYIVNGRLWKMGIDDIRLPIRPVIDNGVTYYSIGIEPLSGDIFLGDAKDWLSNGSVSRFTSGGRLVEEFAVGVCPSSFIFVISL